MVSYESGEQDFWAALYANLKADINRLDGDLPNVKVFNSDQSIVIRLEVPGFKEDELSAKLQDGFIIIEGKVDRSQVQDERRKSSREGDRHDFVMRLPLSKTIDEDKLQLNLSLGVLRVRLPFNPDNSREGDAGSVTI